jgi:Protein of unknown function (DUF3618)
MSDQTTEQIEAEIEAQREQLAQTVDQLTAKLDVKSRASEKLAELRSRPDILAGAALAAVGAIALVWWRRSS